VKKNIEIEFKTQIDENTYNQLLHKYNLKSSQFHQTNYYFDTDSLDLLNRYITLRIRVKKDSVKLTLKQRAIEGSLEEHYIIDDTKSAKLLKKGFNTSTFFPQINYDVKYLTKLDNYRITMLYENGIIFFDKSTYNGITDYEIEYEHGNYEVGLNNFNKFLMENNLKLTKMNKKSYRALTTR